MYMKNELTKNLKKLTKWLKKYNKYVDKFLNIFIPAIMILIPVIFSLYVLNVHGYISIGFRLDIYYRYLLYILVLIYIYKIVIKKVEFTKSDMFICLFMFITILLLHQLFSLTL